MKLFFLHNRPRGLKAVLLLPLALSLLLFAGLHLYTYIDQETEYTEEFVDDAFLSAQRVFDSALRANTDKLSATISVIARDEVLRHAMLAGNRQALLHRSQPLLEKLRKDYGITHLYFLRPDRTVFLRAHQPERAGDLIDRETALQAEATARIAAGLELGPAGTFTLRTVLPWHEEGRLIGYIELGEEVGYMLNAIRDSLALDLFVDINKQYLQRHDWERGLPGLSRKGDWDLLQSSVVVFQTMPDLPHSIRAILQKDMSEMHGSQDISDGEKKYRSARLPLKDAGGKVVGSMLLVRDVTVLRRHSQHDILLAVGVTLGMGSLLLGFFYFMLTRVEEKLNATQAEIQSSEARFRGLVESSSDWIWEIDAQGVYVYVSPNVKKLLGYEAAEVLGKTPFDLMSPGEGARVAALFSRFSAQRQSFQALETSNLHKDGHAVILESSAVPMLGQDGGLLGYRGVDRDITARKQAEQIIQESAQRLSVLFKQTPLAIIEWDADFRVVEWNPAAEHLFGFLKEEALGRHATELILPESSTAHIASLWNDLLTKQGGLRSNNANITKAGKIIHCEWYNTPQVNEKGEIFGVASFALDITDKKIAAERAAYLAYYDDLTGLPNRVLFKESLAQAFLEATGNHRLVGIMFMDVDNFKVVNDTLGHEAGNLLLQAITARLQLCHRSGDTLARFGGDEFALALADVQHVDDIVQVAHHIAENFKAPFDIFGHELFVSFSMGISIYPFDDGNAENLLRDADSAMYAAKAEGRNSYRFYASAMTERAKSHLALQTGLRRALEKNELLLYYQPQLDLASGMISGVEALVRWQHPDRGLLSPQEFITVAEETGLIVPMGEWILREACLQARAWQEQGMPIVRVSVNLSARQFKSPMFAQSILDILKETGLDTRFLELEVTESILVEGMEKVSSILHTFKESGITIALDDFGTGYSSLSYLKRFPIDKLKIDQSFVRDVLTDANDASLVRAIVAMARALGLKVIAEGVETQGQYDFLLGDGCDEIQGYHIGRPLPADQVAELIRGYGRE